MFDPGSLCVCLQCFPEHRFSLSADIICAHSDFLYVSGRKSYYFTPLCAICTTSGKPPTWFPLERLVEQARTAQAREQLPASATISLFKRLRLFSSLALSLSLSFCLSLFVSLSLFVYDSASVNLSLCSSGHPSDRLSVCPSVCLFRPSVCRLSFFLSFCISLCISLSFSLFFCFSVCLSFSLALCLYIFASLCLSRCLVCAVLFLFLIRLLSILIATFI